MAATSRTTAHVVARLSALQAEPERYGFYAALRLLECLHADEPRLGTAARPGEESVRLGQEPSLAFAPSTIARFELGNGAQPAYLSAYLLGLFGPNGPLPLHLTEYAHSRELNFDDPTFRRFADIFHHRLLSLFYRAWAAGQPVVSLDRGGSRRFDTYVGALLGIGAPELRSRDAVADDAKLALAGRLSLATRPAEGLLGTLRSFFGLPFRIREFVGEWLRLPARDHCLLGGPEENATLGRGVVLGAAVWSCQHSFRVVCGPLAFADFVRLLPGSPSLARLRDLVRNYVGDELKWTVNLVLKREEVPALTLGAAGRLGWTTWLGRRNAASDAGEVVIDPFFAGPKQQT
jgi:type VI secretion system protein ImpH